MASAPALPQVRAGAFGACALDVQGKAYCWGNNLAGQGGVPGGAVIPPTPVHGNHTFVDLDEADPAGFAHVCAIQRTVRISTDAVYCWGGLWYGAVRADTPTLQVSSIATYNGISAGGDFNCMLDPSGAATCFGDNWAGQLGNGFRGTYGQPVLPPAAVLGNLSFQRLEAADRRACGLAGGTIYCWGALSQWVLAPAPLTTSMTFTDMDVSGSGLGCGISGGQAYCWGSGSHGELGRGLLQDNIPAPSPSTPVLTLQNLTKISTGGAHVCAINQHNDAFCWGAGNAGELGNADTLDRPFPVLVQGGHKWAQISAGGTFTCGVTLPDATKGIPAQVYCWGINQDQQLGQVTTQKCGLSAAALSCSTLPLLVPLTVAPPPPPPACDPYEPNDDVLSATPVEIGTTITNAALCTATDQDFYKFSVVSERDLYVQLTSPPGTNYDLELWGAGNKILARSTNPAGSSDAVAYRVTPGTYNLRVYSADGSHSATPYALAWLPLALIWPLPGLRTDYQVSRGRWDYFPWTYGTCPPQKSYKRHVAFDLLTSPRSVIIGKEVYAAYAGHATKYNPGEGWADAVVIDHVAPDGSKFSTVYMHLDLDKGVGKGEFVPAGKRLGTVAQLQAPRVSHLHFGVWQAPPSPTSHRGALPVEADNEQKQTCRGDPLFPASFVDPAGFVYAYRPLP